jgi:signal peptidase II
LHNLPAQGRGEKRPPEKFLKKMGCIPVLIIAVIILDQLTKFIVIKNLYPGESLPVIKNIFHITLVCNKGIAFGLFSKYGGVFIWLPLVSVIIICLLWFFYERKSLSAGIYLSLIVAGAIGNLVDRIRFGYVVDFLDFRIWPVFNVADSAITVGTALLIWQMIKHKPIKNAPHTL